MQKVAIAFALVTALSGNTLAQDAAVLDRGKALLTTSCSGCHAIDVEGESTHPQAPAFRTLSTLYPVDTLAEALAEGIMSGHPDMPVFEFEVDDIDAIIAWLEAIQVK